MFIKMPSKTLTYVAEKFIAKILPIQCFRVNPELTSLFKLCSSISSPLQKKEQTLAKFIPETDHLFERTWAEIVSSSDNPCVYNNQLPFGLLAQPG